MRSAEYKQLLLSLIPCGIVFYLCGKLSFFWRNASGGLSERMSAVSEGLSSLPAHPWPELHPADLLFGLTGAILFWLMLSLKAGNWKNFRHGVKYGSARWGTEKDIAPFIHKDFLQNIPLTRTERLTMESRPADPKYARNKNILCIGGSGSGKTRFFVKPSLMQMHSSYVVTDPNR